MIQTFSVAIRRAATRLRLRTRRVRSGLIMSGFLGSAAGIAFAPDVAGAQQLGYTAIPTATRISWDQDLPLTEGWLYGGRLSMLFGSQIELQPFFMRGTKFGVDSAAIATIAATSLTRAFRIDHAGATVQINLSDSDLSPFIRAGGGLLKFSPDSGDDINRLTVLAGGGVRINLGGIHGEVFAEQLRFRMAPALAFGADTSPSGDGTSPATLRNWSYGAAVTIPLSSFEGERTVGLRGTRAPFEPFVGRLTFHDDLGLAEQDLMGIRTGLDFGPLVGVRGFYWRGINRDHDRTEPISGYGGEAQFTLNDGRGVTPYVVLGAGRIDFDNRYRTIAGDPQADQSTLIVGGGAQFNLTDRFQLNVAIRDFIMTRDEQLTAANEPDDLLHNRMLSAGFTFALGGGSRSSRNASPARAAQADKAMIARPGRLAVRDSVSDAVGVSVSDSASTRSQLPKQPAGIARVSTGRAADTVHKADSTRMVLPGTTGTMVSLPVPTVGEIIIRYGLPTDSGVPPKVVRTTVDTVVETVRIVDTVRVTRPETTTVVVPRSRSERETNNGPSSPGFVARLFSARPSDIIPFVGVHTGSSTQAVVSARLDLGPLSNGSRLDLVPEISVAIGGGRTTYMGMANARYTFPGIGGVRPYAMVGGGLSNDKLLVFGTSVGASMNLRSADRSPLYGFAEVQGLNLFNQQRVMVGLSLRR